MRLSSNCRSAISRVFFYLRAPSYCLHFSVGYTKQQTLNFAIYFFLLFEMNFAKGNNLFFLENCCFFTLRVHALRLLAEKYSIPLWRQIERLLKNVIYANSSRNSCFHWQLFLFVLRQLAILMKIQEIFPRSELLFSFAKPVQLWARASAVSSQIKL